MPHSEDAESAAAFRNATLDELAKRSKSGALPPVARSGLAEFLAQWGHRAVAEIDIGMPRWSDDPRHVLGVLASYLRDRTGPRRARHYFRTRGGSGRRNNQHARVARPAPGPPARIARSPRLAPRARARGTAGTAEVLSRPRARRRAPRADDRGIKPRRGGRAGEGRGYFLHRSRRSPRRSGRPGPSEDRHTAARDVRTGAPPPARAARAAVGWDRAGSRGQAGRRSRRPDRSRARRRRRERSRASRA